MLAACFAVRVNERFGAYSTGVLGNVLCILAGGSSSPNPSSA